MWMVTMLNSQCNIKMCWCEEFFLYGTLNNIAVMLTCLLQEWETESVVLERVSTISVTEQAWCQDSGMLAKFFLYLWKKKGQGQY